MIKVIRYHKKHKKSWDALVKDSKNGTFLFFRDYMEYHADRFDDYSLMIFSGDDLLAIFPASVSNSFVTSHGGLTYGGMLYKSNMTAQKAIDSFEATLDYLRKDNVSKVLYKAIPHIYHKQPAEEDLYCLFLNDFRLIKREISSSFLINEMAIKGKKLNGHKKALRAGFELVPTDCSKEILKIVNENLLDRYDTQAVHSFAEMNYLRNKFKKNIQMFNLMLGGKYCGGAILYVDNQCVHAQYIATTMEAKRARGLDFIVIECLGIFSDIKWFDFGISTEEGGRNLNVSLIKAKEEFNMSGICYDTYEISL